jgi:hypothetical protein
MTSVPSKLEGRVVFGIGTVILSFLLFGPVAAWHHTYRFGILGPMILEEEFRVPGRMTWGHADVILSPGAVAGSTVLWLAGITVLWLLCRQKGWERGTAEPGAPPNGGPAEQPGNSGVSGGPPSVS